MLQGYLKSLEDRTVVVVSHDRSFLDAVSQETILFRHKTLAYHTGSYTGMHRPFVSSALTQRQRRSPDDGEECSETV